MNNFGRALRLAVRYPYTLAASVACALAVALFWGGNISAVYPLVEVTTKGRSLQDWAQESIADAAQQEAAHQRQVAQLELALASAPEEKRAALTAQRDAAQRQVAADQRDHAWYEWLLAHVIEPWLPDDAFLTLTLVVALLLAGTVIKSAFFVAHQILVARLAQRVVFNLRKTFYRRTLRMDMATFGDEGTSELMSRFTYDMESLSSGLVDFFGKLIREPLKMITCLVLAIAGAVARVGAALGLDDSLAGPHAEKSQSQGDGRDVADIQYSGRNLSRHQGGQGLHHGASRVLAVSSGEQKVPA